jgi:hypothetical protein
MAKKPGMDVMIAVKPHKRPGSDLSGPGPLDRPSGSPASDEGEPDADDQGGGGGSVGPEDVDYSDNDLCESCKNMGDDGNCTKYNFPVEPTGHCEAGYEPKEGGGETGAEAGGGSPYGGPSGGGFPPGA